MHVDTGNTVNIRIRVVIVLYGISYLNTFNLLKALLIYTPTHNLHGKFNKTNLWKCFLLLYTISALVIGEVDEMYAILGNFQIVYVRYYILYYTCVWTRSDARSSIKNIKTHNIWFLHKLN